MVLIEAVSLIIAIISLCVSIRVYYVNKRISVAAFEQNCYVAIDSALTTFYSVREDSIAFQDDADEFSSSIKDSYLNAAHSVLSAYDIACMNYFKKALDRKAFEVRFSSEITDLCQSEPFKDLLDADDRYANLKQFLQH